MTMHPDLVRLKEPPLLAHHVTDYRGRMPDGDLLVDIKHDGVRALWLGDELVTRQGAPIGGVAVAQAALMRLQGRYGRRMMFDSELIVDGSFYATSRHVAFAAGKVAAVNPQLFIFDAVPLDVWLGRLPPTSLIERRCELEDKTALVDSDHLHCVRSVAFDDPADVESYAAGAIVDGEEGVVIKPAMSGYRRDRRQAWLRIKRTITADCRILGVTPHPESDDMIAGLVVDYEGKPIRITAGFTDENRRLLWAERAIITGRLVEIEAMEATTGGKLRQPRFVRIRYERIWT